MFVSIFLENAAMYRGEPMNVPTEEEADQKRKSQWHG